MNTLMRRFFGISFIIFSVIGILISLGSIYGAWKVRSLVLVKLAETTELVDHTLSTTYDGLSITKNMLVEIMETIDSSENVMLAMSETMSDINQLTSGFLGGFLSRFTGSQGEEDALENPMDSFTVFETELENIAENINQVSISINETQTVVTNYQETINLTHDQLKEFQTSGPRWINTITWVLTVLLIWFSITQVGFIIQGVEFLRSSKTKIPSIPDNALEKTG